MSARGRMAVTGVSGMLGSHVAAWFGARGWEVHGLLRTPEAPLVGPSGDPAELARVRRFAYTLPEAPELRALEGVRVLVHCAATTRSRDVAGAGDADVEGARRLLAAAGAAGVERVVFASSTSARPDAPSAYGRSKHAIEGLLDPERDVALRLGLVLSRGGGGLFRRLVEMLSSARFVPLFGGGRQSVQPVHVDDVCRAIEGALERGVTGTRTVADPSGLAFRDLLARIARRLDRRVTFVPLPYGPVLAGLRAIELLRLPFPITSENLLGLREQAFHPCAGDLEELGVETMGVERALELALLEAFRAREVDR